MSSIYIPGQKLGSIRTYESGPGTYVRGDCIFASVSGVLEETTSASGFGKKKVQIIRKKDSLLVPQIGSIVLTRVTKINTRFATCMILSIDETVLPDPFPAIIRKQDVRKTEIDKVEIWNCFRPGDLVRCKVISLGDTRSYFLSTAEIDLGVVYATSIAGEVMYPISWEEMECPKTKMREHRKVAKIRLAGQVEAAGK
ncbi:putative 3'-5' exoribonuclease [Monocercomonoides exilis]|uniref:putative 3'-5' exoribonuclease n=1 Tax=Monocercomonoides exilis TaxID=2049356 RepID=UPI003559680E|nr:putative 3'-5' exoribonuclease [Monocercomonoides exilis]